MGRYFLQNRGRMKLNMENSTFFKAAAKGSSVITELAAAVMSQGDTTSATGVRTTLGDQMLPGTSQNVFLVKIRLKPLKLISTEK